MQQLGEGHIGLGGGVRQGETSIGLGLCEALTGQARQGEE
jgi:hypothetical protein